MKIKKDKLRKPGEHWYEIVDLFDAEKIQRVSSLDEGQHVFIMGRLDEVTVVEVPKGTAPSHIRTLGEDLQNAGVKNAVFAVTSGVRLLKIRALTAREEALVEARAKETQSEAPIESEAPSV